MATYGAFWRWKGSRGRQGVTLIEMMFVMGMTGLVAAILLPAVFGAREAANRTVCITHQRSIVRGVMQYQAACHRFPRNYDTYSSNEKELWALDAIRRYVGGKPGPQNSLSPTPGSPWKDTGLLEGDFPDVYLCPSADTDRIFAAQAPYQYHASYWTNIAIRANRGWGYLFGSRTSNTPGDDRDSIGPARIYGKVCPGVRSHWRTVYHPAIDTLSLPSLTIFSGDTANEGLETSSHAYLPGEYSMQPGHGRTLGSLGFRHGDRMVVGYLDGHAGTFLKDDLDHWSQFGNGETSGDFLIRYSSDNSCQKTFFHALPPRMGDTE